MALKKPETVERIALNKGRFGGTEFPCPTCGRGREVQIDRRGKPYISCYPCGIQLFVRLDEGIDKMEMIVRATGGREGPPRHPNKNQPDPRVRATHPHFQRRKAG